MGKDGISVFVLQNDLRSGALAANLQSDHALIRITEALRHTSCAGTQIILKDKNGNTVLTHTPELNFAVVILSSPELVKGETYTITVGTQSGDFQAS